MDRVPGSWQLRAPPSPFPPGAPIERSGPLKDFEIPVVASRSLFLGPDDGPKVVAQLPDDFRLVGRMTREVRLSYQTYTHIVSQRAAEASWHVQFVLTRMPGVISDPRYAGRLHDDPRKVELYRWVDGDPCGVCVGVKFLDGESWVSTAFPMGWKSLRKHTRKGRLQLVEHARRSLFTND